MKTIIIVAMMLVPAAALLGSEPPAPSFERVRSKYPSRAQLQDRVDQFKATHAAEFASTKADFDLAIRSMLSLDFPEPPSAKGSHAPPLKEPLPDFFSRNRVVEDIALFNSRGDSTRAAFYQDHIDEISVDKTFALRMVCIDVLVNGWNEWAEWQSQKLRAARERFPDLHVEYAVRRLKVVQSEQDSETCNSSVGPALEIVLDRTRRQSLRERARELVQEAASRNADKEILRYAISAAVHAPDGETRLHFLVIAGGISSALRESDKREFWVSYVGSSDEYVRTMAVDGIVQSIRKPRPGEAVRPRDAELAQMLRNVAQNDPSPRVRQFLQPRLQYYETSDTRPTHQGGRIGDPPTTQP